MYACRSKRGGCNSIDDASWSGGEWWQGDTSQAEGQESLLHQSHLLKEQIITRHDTPKSNGFLLLGSFSTR